LRGVRRSVELEVNSMIGIVGTIILLPIAILGLAFGLVRFGLNVVRALVEDAVTKAAQRLAPDL
jgi:hypothetical protein